MAAWLWANSVNKENAAPSEIAIIVCGWLLIVRLAAEFITAIPPG